ncbi:MAG: GTPase Era [Bacteroidales bacterium]|nr:GTPase Era [Bacteroidales bacterium]MBQ7985365.1 GTPase Era [Bacteroidales bacterium]
MMKSGFVNIIGNPNVGKSTLMNALVGENLSIITYKAQTTRHRIMGILNGDDFQMIFSDTPGIVNAANKLHQHMLGFINNALSDADVFLVVTEIGQTLKNNEILEKIIQSDIPVVLVVNKIDLSQQQTVQQMIDYWQGVIPRACVIPASAKERFNLDKVMDALLEVLPENPPYFPQDELTDKSMRFFASEIIREKILLNYSKEIPYSTEVAIDSYSEEFNMDKISAVIYVERESQKNIIIGKGGQMIKKVGIEARKDIEAFTGKHVYLNLFVKVRNNWRNNLKDLKYFGYENK